MSIKNQKGVGLIETLATLFILSVGLLGIAGLQATGIQAGYSASLRTTAILLAEDISSRMKSNRKGVYDNVVNTMYYQIGSGSTGTNNQCNDSSSSDAIVCDHTQMAAHDTFLWKKNITNSLPAGATGEVVTAFITSTDIGTLVSVTTTITWNEKADEMTYVDNFEILSP